MLLGWCFGEDVWFVFFWFNGSVEFRCLMVLYWSRMVDEELFVLFIFIVCWLLDCVIEVLGRVE